MESSIYTSFSRCRTNLLSIVRNGFWRPDFVLTDGQFIYGKLTNDSMLRRNVTIETADGRWLLRPKSIWKQGMFIFDALTGEDVGKTEWQVWNNRVNLEMTNGFNSVLNKQGIFSRNYFWSDDNLSELMNIRVQFRFSTPFSVTINQSAATNKINIPLMAFIAVQIITQKQSQAAAH